MQISIVSEGDEEIKKKLSNLEKVIGIEKLNPILLKAAQKVRDRIRLNIPLGPTGNLRKAAFAMLMPKRGDLPAAAFVSMRTKKFPSAPHAHLVEKGTGDRYQKTTGRYTGLMRARPYFKPTVQGMQSQIESEISKEVLALIEGSFK